MTEFRKVTIEEMVQRWTSMKRPLFKGKLIDNDGCCCAQGDVLRVCGFSDDSLREMSQSKADKETASRLGISTLQAVLLRNVNDSKDGCPQEVLTNPSKILGPNADLILGFGGHIDAMNTAAVDAARAAAWAAVVDAARAAARAAAVDAAGDAARAAAGDAAWAAAGDAAWAAAGDAARAAARNAAVELCGWNKLPGKPFFLPIMGVEDPVAFVEEIRPDANRQREAYIKSLEK